MVAAKMVSVVKKFGELTALDGFNLEVPTGTCYGLLGPNGAGKSTAIHILQAVSQPQSGQVEVLGLDPSVSPRSIKAQIGVVSQEDNLDPDFTVFQNLTTFSRFFGIPPAEAAARADELLNLMELEGKRDGKIMELSGGMKRRLVVARALVGNPKLLIMDEPTTGLDPQARQNLWSMIRKLKKQGMTILLTTHYMDEAEVLCDELVIMDKGILLAKGTPVDLIAEHVGATVVEALGDPVEALHEEFKAADIRFEVATDRTLAFDARAEAMAKSYQERRELDGVLIRRGTLEDVFLALTGRGLRDA